MPRDNEYPSNIVYKYTNNTHGRKLPPPNSHIIQTPHLVHTIADNPPDSNQVNTVNYSALCYYINQASAILYFLIEICVMGGGGSQLHLVARVQTLGGSSSIML